MSLIFILLGTFFLLAFLGVPIAISLGVASGIGMLTAGVSVSGIAQRMFAGVDSFSYLAIPMFMLAGKLMEYGGISARIVQVAKILCAKVRGGLAITSIVACSFFAALSGSAPATVSAIGGIMYPEMLKDGYDEEFAGGMISVAGNLGPLIPPSILMVTIGVCTGVSISDMFLGGIVIGILLAAVFCLTAYVICRRRNYGGSGQTYSSKEKWRIFWYAYHHSGRHLRRLLHPYGGIRCGGGLRHYRFLLHLQRDYREAVYPVSGGFCSGWLSDFADDFYLYVLQLDFCKTGPLPPDCQRSFLCVYHVGFLYDPLFCDLPDLWNIYGRQC